ncbi:MAG: hypothetical protein AUJ37_02090 [Candidatus Magasanikbacteria bacterium CG1_02_41_34]|nr:MAG: hypothetical protein AUJ37_02090 [Candidatus Magasanikbacteria bacterium CG1_02_41_34]
MKTVKDYLFPVFCLSCGIEGFWMCDNCFSFIDITTQLFCPLCHEKTSAGEVCLVCMKKQLTSFLTQHIASTMYEESGRIGKIIHTLKYDFADDSMPVIEKIIQTWVKKHRDHLPDVDVIIPVPLHKKRYAERGFNQAILLARVLAKEGEIPIDENILTRSRNTPHQARLDREGRLQNVKEAFHVFTLDSIQGKRVLLVDDVYTTGATMQTCAEALLASGASSVYGWTLARG